MSITQRLFQSFKYWRKICESKNLTCLSNFLSLHNNIHTYLEYIRRTKQHLEIMIRVHFINRVWLLQSCDPSGPASSL